LRPANLLGSEQDEEEMTVMYNLPSPVWALVLIAVGGISTATGAMLYRSAVASGLTRRTGVGVGAAAVGILEAWAVASGLLAGAGVYSRTPWFGVAFASAFTGMLLATRIPVVARVLADPGTPARLTLPHTLRVSGALFLIAMAAGALPAVFALPAALGDIAIGASAPFVARRLARSLASAGAVRFNVLGIADLVAALGIGLLAGLGPWRPLGITPSTQPLELLPLALIPTVAVPLAINLHIVSLRRLYASGRSSARPPQVTPSSVGSWR
jgi:hypothetical protein